MSNDKDGHGQARETLRGHPTYFNDVYRAYAINPFLKLTEEESREIPKRLSPQPLGQLVAARDAATRSTTRKYVVFCMPKSASSFLASALRHAFDLPSASLTSFCPPHLSSHFGMNAREQELDELAIVRSAIACRQGFVAQHHTRYTPYLAHQMRLYGLTPILAIRNILDCIVSFDDMMCVRESREGNWRGDPQFALPTGFHRMNETARYTILTHSYGVWLINFYLSWKRGLAEQQISAPVIRYEEDVSDGERLTARLSAALSMTDHQEARLRSYVRAPDLERSRFNVGRAGRGEERLPEPLKLFLDDYARLFKGDLTDEDIRYLVR